jgi:hypothetical protein
LPHKVDAQEADGSVKFGHGDGSAYLFDPDIYTDGRISVQGIDGVLFPHQEEEVNVDKDVTRTGQPAKVVAKQRRGALLCFLLNFCFCFVLFGCVLSQDEKVKKYKKGDYDVFHLIGLKFSLCFSFGCDSCSVWLEFGGKNNWDEKEMKVFNLTLFFREEKNLQREVSRELCVWLCTD